MSERDKLCTVFVGGISWKADETKLKEFFGRFGDVSSCKIIVDRETNKSKGYGFVTFKEPETAEAVKNATELNFLGKTMNVGNAYRKNSSPKRAGQHPMNPGGMYGYPIPYVPYGPSFVPYPPYMGGMPAGYDPYFGGPSAYYDGTNFWPYPVGMTNSPPVHPQPYPMEVDGDNHPPPDARMRIPQQEEAPEKKTEAPQTESNSED